MKHFAFAPSFENEVPSNLIQHGRSLAPRYLFVKPSDDFELMFGDICFIITVENKDVAFELIELYNL